ncbi:acetyltransferase [Streptomyces sp. DSM 41982]|uniref:Acetyltransferase n=1 Tax=Streptomyces evansiae TaxID=3075535 RepID=A0ABD5EG83_9ACTN|nr:MULTISPECIES: acetyltransferase [unclassified Streptomyces]MDT0419668.1 acetyltransferase [Streptomyces sp. DSM 41982]
MSNSQTPPPAPSSAELDSSDEELRRILLAAYDAQLRGESEFADPRARVEHDGPLVRFTGVETGYITGPRDLGVEGDALDALIARQRDRYAELGIEAEWKTRGHDAQKDLPERLRAAGFVPDEPETVFVGRTEDLARLEPRLPEGLRMRSATSLADLRRIDAMNEEIWGERHAHADELHRVLTTSPENVTVLLVEPDPDAAPAATSRTSRPNTPDTASSVAPDAAQNPAPPTPDASLTPTPPSTTPPPPIPLHASRIEFVPGTDFAGLWGGSTLAAWRGRGLYRATVAARARIAAARGVRYLQVDASADSAPILRRLGFVALTTTTPYIWTPPAG